MDNALEPIAKQQLIKIDQESKLITSETQIGHHLCDKYIVECLDGLYFKNKLALDQNIYPIPAFQMHPFINKRPFCFSACKPVLTIL